MNPAARAEAHIKQLCCLGLPSQAIMPTLLAQLHSLIPNYAGCFYWADDNYQITNIYFENFDDTEKLLPLYLSEFCNRREGEVITSVGAALRYDQGVKTVEDSLKVDERGYHRHDYYNLIMRPVHYHYGMRMVVRQGGRTLGAILMHRDYREGGFTMEDKRKFAALASFVAHAVSAPEDNGIVVPLVESETSGLMVVDRQVRLQYASPDARRLLFLATHPQVDANILAAASAHFSLPAQVLQLCKNLVNIFEGKQMTVGSPVWQHRNAWGGFTFRAYWLNYGRVDDDGFEPSPLIGITIQHEVPLPIKLIRKLEQSSLSRRQIQICLLIAAGHSHSEIAKRLSMSGHTVVTHLRRLYDKLDVHNRADLISKLLAI